MWQQEPRAMGGQRVALRGTGHFCPRVPDQVAEPSIWAGGAWSSIRKKCWGPRAYRYPHAGYIQWWVPTTAGDEVWGSHTACVLQSPQAPCPRSS